MGLVIQNFKSWQSSTSKNINSYIEPTSKSIFIVVSANFIELIELGLWNNLQDGDLVNLSTDDELPLGLVNSYYIRKDISPRISLHTSKNNALNNISPFNFTNNGIGNHTLSFNFGKILKCTFKGITGTSEPIWNRITNSIVLDGSCEWKVINPLVSDINPLDFLPEARQEEKSFQQISELLGHQLALAQQEKKALTEKYIDYPNLDDKYLKELIAEFGYDYLVEASILDTNQLSVLYSYLKLIHFLKGTRTGLKLTLDLLGYTYIEKLWYEEKYNVDNWVSNANYRIGQYVKPSIDNSRFYKCVQEGISSNSEPTWSTTIGSNVIDNTVIWEVVNIDIYSIGEPHTFLLNLTTPLSLANVITVNNLYKFLRYYVYPLATIITDILPFNFLTMWTGGGGFGDAVHEFSMNFEIPFIGSSEVFLLPYLDGIGSIVSDISDNINDANIIQTESDPNAVFRFVYDTQSSPIQDLTANNNDANIISFLVTYDLFNFAYTDGSGTNISDGSINNNDSSIIANVIDLRLFQFNFSENTGTTINDSSLANNDSSIIASTPDILLFAYDYSEGTGITLNNNGGTAGNASIISTSDIPQPENLIAWYKLENNVNDFSGNTNHATQNGGTFGVFGLTLTTADYLLIPNTVLNGVSDFSIGGWFDLTAVNSNFNTILSLSTTTEFNSFYLAYNGTKKTFEGKFVNQNYILSEFDVSLFTGQDDFETGEHHVILTRKNNFVSLYIDGELRAIGNFFSGNLAVDSLGLIIGQEQDSYGGSFDTTQALDAKIDNLIFYNIALNQDEINKWYNKARV